MLTAWLGLFCLFLALPSPPCIALELWSSQHDEQSLTMLTGLKFTTLLSRAQDAPLLFPERNNALGLGRLRFDFNLQLDETWGAQLAYEQRASKTWGERGAIAGAGVLTGFEQVPYRLNQLDWHLSGSDSFSHRHEIDRALVRCHVCWGDITLGRQAIGLGRGVIFSAIDFFAPFSPLDVDREWRRGVDAARVEYRLSDTSAVEGVAVASEEWETAALLGRYRGYVGNIDGELLIGKRAEDVFAACAVSGVLGEGELHGELALFRTPEAERYETFLGLNRVVAKAVVGGSYTFNVGNGLSFWLEYFYGGFGLESTDDAFKAARSLDYQQRFALGDLQVLGQHAVGTQLIYPINQSWSASLLALASPSDWSGVVSPTLSWDISDHSSLRATGLLSWGERPRKRRIGSEYGASPASLLVQLSFAF